MPDTLKAQHVSRLTSGVALYSDMGRVLASITHDTCGWHDTITGHSTAAHIARRWGAASYQEHRNDWRRSARDAFLVELAKHGLGARDLVANVNFFTKVAVGEHGDLAFVEGNSGGRGERHAALRARHARGARRHAAPARPRDRVEPAAGAPRRRLGRRRRRRRRRPPRVRRERARLSGERGGAAMSIERDVDRRSEPARTEDPRPRLDVEVGAGDGWIGVLAAGEHLLIVDLHGNQAVDTLFFDARDHANRYSAVDTLREQAAAYLELGSVLRALDGEPLVTIVADTCGRHDTLGGACSQESNVVRYGEHTRHMHACRNTFLAQALAWGGGLEKRDLSANVNFFMNVPLTAEGGLTFEDGISAPGKLVELRADRDTLVLISNCPQLNNPCNGFDPTPVRLVIR